MIAYEIGRVDACELKGEFLAHEFYSLFTKPVIKIQEFSVEKGEHLIREYSMIELNASAWMDLIKFFLSNSLLTFQLKIPCQT